MHIPEAERAISQLIRVAKPGGFIVLEEVNQSAPEARDDASGLVGTLKKGITVTKTPRGYEQTSRFEGETLFWRHVNVAWLVTQFASALLQPCSARQQYAFRDVHLHPRRPF